MFLSLFSSLALFTLFSWCYSNSIFITTIFRPRNTEDRQGICKYIFTVYGNYSMYTTAIYTNQGNDLNIDASMCSVYKNVVIRSFLKAGLSSVYLKNNSIRILAALWLLAATVLVNSYSGTLITSLTVTKLKPTVNSLEDLAASNDLVMTVSSNSVMSQNIFVSIIVTLVVFHGLQRTYMGKNIYYNLVGLQNGTSNTLKTITATMRKHPESIYLTPEEGLDRLFSLKYAFPTVSYMLSFYLYSSLQYSEPNQN